MCRLEPENQGLQKDRDACMQLWVDQNQPPPPKRHAIAIRQSRMATSPILAGGLDSDPLQASTGGAPHSFVFNVVPSNSIRQKSGCDWVGFC